MEIEEGVLVPLPDDGLFVCRLCLIGSVTGGAFVEGEEVLKKIEFVAGIEIPRNEKALQVVCEKCFDSLQLAHGLKKQIKFTQKFVWSSGDDKESASAGPLASDEVHLHCHACDRQFNYLEPLREHLLSDHSEDNHMDNCLVCNSLGVHQHQPQPQHHQDDNEPEFIEVICDEDKDEEQLEGNQALKKKRNSKSGRKNKFPKIFDCPRCDKSYTRMEKLRDHLKQVHNVELPRVINEGVIFTVNSEDPLKDQVSPFPCPRCEKSYSRKEKLKQHMIRHHDVHQVPQLNIAAEFSCSKCDKTYISQTAYDKHLLEHDLYPFQCDYCRLAFQKRGDRRAHEMHCVSLTVLGDGRNKCLFCGDTLDSLESLKAHVHICESKNGEQTCDVCQETFVNIQELLVHKEKEHLVEVMCLVCSKSFKSRLLLKRHIIRAHQALECKVCGQTLSRPDKLAEHMYLHTGFPCSTCGVVLKTRRDYCLHRKKHRK